MMKAADVLIRNQFRIYSTYWTEPLGQTGVGYLSVVQILVEFGGICCQHIAFFTFWRQGEGLLVRLY